MKGLLLGLALCAAVYVVVRAAAPRPPDAHSWLALPADPRARAAAARADEKQLLIDKLVAGVLRLSDAIDRVLTLNEEWPPLPPERYDCFPGDTLRERVGGALIYTAELVVPPGPQRDSVCRRLTAELAGLQSCPVPETHAIR